tara:strand:+ start:487 stop:1023 length:537 start_codon:yes stop_codon:yes gene_type:complete
MKLINTKLEGIKLISLEKFKDNRGEFYESFNEQRYKDLGLDINFLQDNYSTSMKNVLRGLHFCRSNPQIQIVTVLRGKIFDVVVDLRKNSKTFGKWLSFELSDQFISQIYMGKGFAHGFYVLSEFADLHYKVSENYNDKDDFGIFWDDRDLSINWPCKDPILSEKDKKYPSFKEIKFT